MVTSCARQIVANRGGRTVKPEASSDTPPLAHAVVMDLREQSIATSHEAIRLESCCDLDWILVTTRGSQYELVVIDPYRGDVMIRGGRFFPEFRRAIVTGSTFGGSVVRLRTICVGLRLELQVHGKSVLTSQINAASRLRPGILEGRA